MSSSLVEARAERGVFHALRRVLLSEIAARITSYVAFFLAWELLSAVVPRVPGPVPVADFIWTEISGGHHGGVLTGQFFEHFGPTLYRFAVGIGLAFVAGMAVAILIGTSSLARALMNDTLLVLLALPAFMWAFLAIMWFGLGDKPPILTTALSGGPFVAVNVIQGLRAMPRDLKEMSNAFGVNRLRQLRDLVLPAITGYVFAGLRFAVIVGWNGVLLSEWFGATEGIGWRTRYWYDANRYQGFVGWVAVFIVFIVVLDRLLLARLERRAFQWRDSDPSGDR